jgi:hypothetical protein
LQFSAEALPFPDNYQVEAARIVSQKRADPQKATVSYPRQTLGVSAFSPQRWYVCIRGVSEKPKPDRLPKAAELAARWLDPQTDQGTHNIVLFFGTTVRPTAREGYDSPLCREGQYEPITAEPPLT